MMQNLAIFGLMVVVVIIYWMNNPIGHDKEFRKRCLVNWLTIGLAYAFLYMGRYNINAATAALGENGGLTGADFGIIFGAGTWTYAASLFINGPLVDKIGGYIGILIGLIGSCIMNVALGIATYLFIKGNLDLPIIPTLAVIYSINMYFQSFGAASIVKTNSNWFHVKERGIAGGIFGTLIAMGLFFSFDWSSAIRKATNINLDAAQLDSFQIFIRDMLGTAGGTTNAYWYLFFIPAAILALFVVLVFFLVKETPKDAGLKNFDTEDASSGEMERKFTTMEIIKEKILGNPVIITVAVIELCSGVIRQGVMQWLPRFNEKMHFTDAAAFIPKNWGLLLCLAGTLGGMFAGIISDKVFKSRRIPSALILYVILFIGAILMTHGIFTGNYFELGAAAILVSFAIIGVHGMLSGVLSQDLLGRKGAATGAAMFDGCVYIGTGIQSLALGYITEWDWNYWPVFILPFTLIGIVLCTRVLKAFPEKKKNSEATAEPVKA